MTAFTHSAVPMRRRIGTMLTIFVLIAAACSGGGEAVTDADSKPPSTTVPVTSDVEVPVEVHPGLDRSERVRARCRWRRARRARVRADDPTTAPPSCRSC